MVVSYTKVFLRQHTDMSKEPAKHDGKTGVLPAPPGRQRKLLRGSTCLGHGKLLQNHGNGVRGGKWAENEAGQ